MRLKFENVLGLIVVALCVSLQTITLVVTLKGKGQRDKKAASL